MPAFVSPDRIRSLFAQAMSDMYRTEVPLYGDLVTLVGGLIGLALFVLSHLGEIARPLAPRTPPSAAVAALR